MCIQIGAHESSGLGTGGLEFRVWIAKVYSFGVLGRGFRAGGSSGLWTFEAGGLYGSFRKWGTLNIEP